jgi:hypothetical protein
MGAKTAAKAAAIAAPLMIDLGVCVTWLIVGFLYPPIPWLHLVAGIADSVIARLLY